MNRVRMMNGAKPIRLESCKGWSIIIRLDNCMEVEKSEHMIMIFLASYI